MSQMGSTCLAGVSQGVHLAGVVEDVCLADHRENHGPSLHGISVHLTVDLTFLIPNRFS